MSYDELTSKNVIVRKKHYCEWCGESIPKGDPAHYRSYIFNMDFNWGWAHPECEAAMGCQDWDLYRDGFESGGFLRGTIEER